MSCGWRWSIEPWDDRRVRCVGCQATISLKDALCLTCGRFVVGDLSEEQRRKREAARGAGRIVVAAIGLGILGFVVWMGMMEASSFERMARLRAASDAQALAAASTTWLGSHAGGCPTPERLRADGEISRGSKLTDPWDRPYRIECPEEGSLVVRSDGPDRRVGTADDISAQPSADSMRSTP